MYVSSQTVTATSVTYQILTRHLHHGCFPSHDPTFDGDTNSVVGQKASTAVHNATLRNLHGFVRGPPLRNASTRRALLSISEILKKI